ncbi:hypothetical protein HOR94_gp18 [Leclercia phage 10164-302]|uniref:Uncharacterized protein n=2 Tax=Teetrevirus tv10164302 TaxID=2732708 RepID=A0A289YUU0_9CAUD|nr:hypothetical protein HOR94_gp18 [Leclercia phage 10164-302]ATA65261.1 hypothetical protein 10164302_00018 [Leclercia phage 10164-302]ATA65307.1 hypothetical protein 10164RH_00018 [Leclercia phage 10164RH]
MLHVKTVGLLMVTLCTLTGMNGASCVNIEYPQTKSVKQSYQREGVQEAVSL